MLHNLGLVGLVVIGVAVMAVVMSGFRSRPAVRVPVRVWCYQQTAHPVSIVCRDASYWHPLGPTTPPPGVPKA